MYIVQWSAFEGIAHPLNLETNRQTDRPTNRSYINLHGVTDLSVTVCYLCTMHIRHPERAAKWKPCGFDCMGKCDEIIIRSIGYKAEKEVVKVWRAGFLRGDMTVLLSEYNTNSGPVLIDWQP